MKPREWQKGRPAGRELFIDGSNRPHVSDYCEAYKRFDCYGYLWEGFYQIRICAHCVKLYECMTTPLSDSLWMPREDLLDDARSLHSLTIYEMKRYLFPKHHHLLELGREGAFDIARLDVSRWRRVTTDEKSLNLWYSLRLHKLYRCSNKRIKLLVEGFMTYKE